MDALVGFLLSLAVVAIAGAGFATIAGLPPLRGRCLGVAVVAVLLSLLLPAVGRLVRSAFSIGSPGVPIIGTSMPAASSVLVPFLVGHVTLAAALLRRRLGGVERGRREAAEVERARGRGRRRISPETEREEPEQ